MWHLAPGLTTAPAPAPAPLSSGLPLGGGHKTRPPSRENLTLGRPIGSRQDLAATDKPQSLPKGRNRTIDNGHDPTASPIRGGPCPSAAGPASSTRLVSFSLSRGEACVVADVRLQVSAVQMRPRQEQPNDDHVPSSQSPSV
ncbi:hypothetical protein K456DRAFT_113451 [Colletotrichum gloeosporioides 23]|nr:hypothetical protein K456DRAFT_113451 [Colletotrichum gloeosporioides 23]